MKFTTPIQLQEYPKKLDYQSRMFSMGSCFAEHLGQKFNYFQFAHLTNSFGIIFNPVSLERIISRVVEHRKFTEDDLFFYNEGWHCFEVHSECSHFEKEEMLFYLNQQLEQAHYFLSKADFFILTLGTAWVYRHLESNEIVANCHKVPAAQFQKELLEVEAIEASLKDLMRKVADINPKLQFIFTISPVRHLKDGFVENQRSKSHLISALHSSISHLPSSHYFPSYEIVMDELRDYRFFEEDMLHPNAIAVDYIWEKFSESVINPSVYPLMKEVESIQKSLYHRPFNPNSEAHLQFKQQLTLRIEKLKARIPNLTFL
ncbi:MAG: GSCFA domain-containing protein [Flavobacterium sp.]